MQGNSQSWQAFSSFGLIFMPTLARPQNAVFGLLFRDVPKILALTVGFLLGKRVRWGILLSLQGRPQLGHSGVRWGICEAQTWGRQ